MSITVEGVTSRWYPETLYRRIMDIIERKDRLLFIQGDGLQYMEEHAHRADTVWFIDPPYTIAGKRLYKYSDIDHNRLFEIAASVTGHFLITYDNAAEIRYLADKHHLDYRLIEMKTTHHTQKYELLISRSFDWLPSSQQDIEL